MKLKSWLLEETEYLHIYPCHYHQNWYDIIEWSRVSRYKAAATQLSYLVNMPNLLLKLWSFLPAAAAQLLYLVNVRIIVPNLFLKSRPSLILATFFFLAAAAQLSYLINVRVRISIETVIITIDLGQVMRIVLEVGERQCMLRAEVVEESMTNTIRILLRICKKMNDDS